MAAAVSGGLPERGDAGERRSGEEAAGGSAVERGAKRRPVVNAAARVRGAGGIRGRGEASVGGTRRPSLKAGGDAGLGRPWDAAARRPGPGGMDLGPVGPRWREAAGADVALPDSLRGQDGHVRRAEKEEG